MTTNSEKTFENDNIPNFIKCSVCGSPPERHRFLFSIYQPSSPWPVLTSSRYIVCLDCGFVAQSPRLPEQAYLTWYASQSGGAGAESGVERLEKAVKEIRFLETHVDLKNISILDVGCGNGHLLVALRDSGVRNLAGIEPSDTAVQHCREILGLNVHKGTIGNSDLEPGTWDMVTLSAILEHAWDPGKLLEEASKRIATGGFLYIRVPDLLATRLLPWHPRSYRLRGIFTLAHVSYFTEQTLAILAARHGFEAIASMRLPKPSAGELWAIFRKSGMPNSTLTHESPFKIFMFVKSQTFLPRLLTNIFDHLPVWMSRGLLRRLGIRTQPALNHDG